MTDHNDGQEFNDDELQEIMGEIESLEQEFGEEANTSASEGSEELDLAETERQLKELEDSVEEEPVDDSKEVEVEVEEVHTAEEHHEEAPHNDNVVAMDSGSSEGGNVTLGAQGSMTLNLTFQVAGKDAKLKIDGPSLVVDLDGVHFHIDEKSGCVFEMPGGVKFQVPLDGKGDFSKAS